MQMNNYLTLSFIATYTHNSNPSGRTHVYKMYKTAAIKYKNTGTIIKTKLIGPSKNSKFL